MRIGVYPGTFDPVTNGHLDIIKRGAGLFDKLYILVANNINKHTLFSVDERIQLLKDAVLEWPNVEVVTSSLLTVEFAASVGAKAMLRGLRMVSDFEYELQMATLNKNLNSQIETIFIMSSHEYSFLSSSSVKEIARFDGDVSSFVPKHVELALQKKR
ncbi:MAG: pantetheine-phosphate adenylyltransferase [Prevotella sp.]|nr:pantetheine-phosphate adenylyltransferase [Staphylococcus sp.]MCM1350087.1 pantetheine-phosphate adenylyltransferase [Prevotella sp.]